MQQERYMVKDGWMDGRTGIERDRKPMGRKVTHSQQGKLMCAAELEIVRQECGFSAKKQPFFSSGGTVLQKKLPKIISSGGGLLLLRGKSDDVVSYHPHPLKTHYLLYPRTQQWFM